jgi:hypothetical protein
MLRKKEFNYISCRMCHAGIICGKFAFKCNNMCPFCRDPLFDDEDNDNNNKENIPLRRLTKRQKDKENFISYMLFLIIIIIIMHTLP